MTAADILITALHARGVDFIATLCGHGLDPLFQSARAAGLRLVDTRNEQTAAYLADAYGRLTRRPGVCAVSSGVAHVNALSGVANAWFDGSPMLLLTGAGAAATEGLGHFQDMDQVALARPITKYARAIRAPERTLQILDEAWANAIAAPTGPVHLTLPMDVQCTEIPAEAIVPPARLHPATVTASDLDAAARAVAAAQTPLVVAGSGAFYGREGDALLRFCEAASVPLVTPIWDRGSVDRPSPAWLGVIGAATGGPSILPDADCVILAGTVSDYRTNYLRTQAPIVPFLEQWDALAERLADQPSAARTAWFAECQNRRDAFRAAIVACAEAQARDGMHAVHIVRALEQVLPDDPVLLIDGGSIGQWAHQLLCSSRYPGHWLTCGRSGVVGWGIGGAMAARLAFPQRPVILLSGDGSFTFTAADLEPAVRQGLPFVAIVADDQGWGITRDGHIRQFGAPIASSLGPIAFDRLAESLGARGVRASTPHHLSLELRRALDTPAVTVIHVPIVGGTPSAA